MCGINGILSYNQKKVNRADLQKMLDNLTHRGPDEEGLFIDKQIGLGSCRLSIIDINGGHQPIFNEDKSLAIVFNGEIYNYLELRNKLLSSGHRFQTFSDTETILHLYEDLGKKCLDKLDGMFAFAIYDFKKNELFIARDPIGKKPLYWVKTEKCFIFSSELKSILTLPEYKKEIDKDSLSKYFFYGYVPSPNTIFKGIKRLSSGNYLVVNDKEIKEEKKYWEINYSIKLKNKDFSEIKEETKFLLQKAVKKRLVADVPIGIFLSGGIDSSLIVALAENKKLEAFTIGFEDKKTDESNYAKLVADYLGIKQNLKIFSDKEALLYLPKALTLMDEPMADPSILPTFLLSAFTKKKVKVALSGDGGDEYFSGYPKYLVHSLLMKSHLDKINFSKISGLFPEKIKTLLRYSHYPLYQRNQFWLNSFSLSEVQDLTGEKTRLSDLEKYHRVFNGEDLLDEAFFLDQKMTLTDLFLVKVDRASMANSLEVRCPFLDKDLIEFSAKIPSAMKTSLFRTKPLLREIAKDYLPKEIINLSKKGFGIPLEKWLKEDLSSLVNHYLSYENIKEEGILNYDVITKILKRNGSSSIWRLLVFEIWLNNWMLN